MFRFLGVFASPSRDMASEFARLWPEADFAVFKKPFKAAAVRLTKEAEASSEGELPDHVVEALSGLSKQRPKTRFMVLRADCWGGVCAYAGKIVESGTVLAEHKGQQSLRPLIGHFGVDIGARQAFAPLTRSFRWTPFGKPANRAPRWLRFLGL